MFTCIKGTKRSPYEVVYIYVFPGEKYFIRKLMKIKKVKSLKMNRTTTGKW